VRDINAKWMSQFNAIENWILTTERKSGWIRKQNV
jgi:hypothetical protein